MNLEGGQVKYTPPRVLTPTEIDNAGFKKFDIPEKTKLETAIDDAFKERDRIISDLLDLDDKYDLVQATINDQLKNMNIPVSNKALREAVRAFGGDDTITKDIYDKAKRAQQAISTVMGVNPLHLPFATPTRNGNALIQYTGDIAKTCADILDGFPNKKQWSKFQITPFVPNRQGTSLDNDGIGQASDKTTTDEFKTLVEDLIAKAKFEIMAFITYKLFWDIIYHKFLKLLILFHPKILASLLKPWTQKKIIGKFVAKIYCWVVKVIYFFDNIPLIFGLRPPAISGDKKFTDQIINKSYGTSENDLSFKYTDEVEENVTTTHVDKKPFKDENIELTVTQMKDCTIKDEINRTKTDSNIEENHTITERKKKVAEKMYSCKLKVNSIFGGTPPDDADVPGGEEDAEGCVGGQVRLLVEDIAGIMGNGIDENSPFQEGFIPPPCYEYASQILNKVLDDALNANKGSKVDTNYSTSAVILDGIVNQMRDFHEVSKFMVTIQDNSEGSKKLMDNTANNKKYNQIFMNKDVINYRNSLFNKRIKNV